MILFNALESNFLKNRSLFVKKLNITACFLAILSPLLATDYAFLNEDTFIDQEHILHIESDYSVVGSASFENSHLQNTKLNYSEGNASAYFTHFFDQENALVWQVGANYVGLGWKDNPVFTQDNYAYGITSLGLVSHSLEKWKWIINGGVAVSAKTFNFGQSGVYFTTLWGRYEQRKNLGVHLGFFAYYGALNGYVLPILGLDWKPAPKWELKAIFPLEASLTHHFTDFFTSSVLATSLGGPYRFPRRIQGGIGEDQNGIFKVFSTAMEWNLQFAIENFCSLGAGGGYDFGGWIQVANEHSHHKRYYNFNGAPYARIFGSITF